MRRLALATVGVICAILAVVTWSAGEPALLSRSTKLLRSRSTQPWFSSYAWADSDSLYYVDERTDEVHRIDIRAGIDEIDARLTQANRSTHQKNAIQAASPDGVRLLCTFTRDAARGNVRYTTIGWTLLPLIGAAPRSYTLDVGGGAMLSGKPLWSNGSAGFVVPAEAYPMGGSNIGYLHRMIPVDGHTATPRLTDSINLPPGNSRLLGVTSDGRFIAGKMGGAYGPNNRPRFLVSEGGNDSWREMPTRYPQRRTDLTRVTCALSPDGARVLWIFNEESRVRRLAIVDDALSLFHIRRPQSLSDPRLVLWVSRIDGSHSAELGVYPLRPEQNLQGGVTQGLQAKWTPDSKRISFVQDGDFYVLDVPNR